MSENKRFDNWEKVDCNECVNWWNDSCNGAPQGSEKLCTAFKAQRSVVIPAEIKELRESVKRLREIVYTESIILLLLIFANILWG